MTDFSYEFTIKFKKFDVINSMKIQLFNYF